MNPLREEACKELRSFLEGNVAAMKMMFAERPGIYLSSHHFVLEHGEDFEVRPWDGRFSPGRKKECFSNAFILSVQAGLTYVEGFAVSSWVPFPVYHAWNLDEEGRVIDLTWQDYGLAYRGIRFATGRVDDAIMNGSGCVIDDWQRNWPVMQQRWAGEDFTKLWPETRQVRVIRKHTHRFEAALADKE